MRSALGGIVLALLVPGVVRAQSLADLKAAKARLTRESDSLQRLTKLPPVMDTVRLGDGWVVAVSPAARDLVDSTTLAALQAGEARFGGVLDPRSTPVEIRFDSARSWAGLEVGVGAGRVSLSRTEFQASTRRHDPVPSLIKKAFTGAAFGIADSALLTWAGGTLEVGFADLVDAARIRLQRDTGVDVLQCRQHSLAACVRALGGGTPTPSVPEFTSVVRRSLVRYALERSGGDSALPRLYADRGRPVLVRLAALAGMPVDTLVAQWHEVVIRQDELTSGGAALALFGAAVLLALGIWGAQWRGV
ncbi:MAG: hypothetical protein ACREOE_01720 [Gemmatimonadales bacterium]